MLIGMDIQMIVILALLVLVVMLCVMLSWALRRGGKASRARNRRAQLGESDAEALLERFGFGIVDRQVREKGWIWLDGEAFDFEVRADLLVERDDELYIAEVKTGVMAPDPGTLRPVVNSENTRASFRIVVCFWWMSSRARSRKYVLMIRDNHLEEDSVGSRPAGPILDDRNVLGHHMDGRPHGFICPA